MAFEHQQMVEGDRWARQLHDPDDCEICLESVRVETRCRCGHCCELLILEASSYDALREPKIKERGKPLRWDDDQPPGTEDWLLNSMEGPCVFFSRNTDGQGVCEIYDTRPLMCRVFNCDDDERCAEFREANAE